MAGDGASNNYEIVQQLKVNYLEDVILKCNVLSNITEQAFCPANDGHIMPELRRVIHSMKGTAAMHDMAMISAICHRFEDFLMDEKLLSNIAYDDIVNHIVKFLDLIDMSAVIELQNCR